MQDERLDETGASVIAPLAPNRSLVFVERRRRGRSLVQAPADFVAQLIACAKGVEQFRRARREEAAQGTKRYRPAEASLARGFERHV